MVIAWVKALETCRAATFWGLCSEEGLQEAHLFVFASVSLYKAADGNERVFKSQRRKNKLDFLKHC